MSENNFGIMLIQYECNVRNIIITLVKCYMPSYDTNVKCNVLLPLEKQYILILDWYCYLTLS